jgi:hypothetical protein
MIQLNILSGKKAGGQLVVRHFPFHIGRATGNDLQLDDYGVWNDHAVLEFQSREHFKLTTSAGALVTVNTSPVQNMVLRNGDIIDLGSARLQFWLAAAAQRGLRVREGFVWVLLVSVTLGQIALIYWLVR